jgi:RNA recognition motif-containing protein
MATGKRLYIGNLSYRTTEEGLRAAFGQDGRTVTDVKIVSDRATGQSRGFGFVELSTDQEAQAAIAQWDGQDLDGRKLRVAIAQERQGGGGGGGYGGGGGGGYGDEGGGGRGRGGGGRRGRGEY